MRTPGLKMAEVKVQHKNCLQSTLWKKKNYTSFAGLGRSVLCQRSELSKGLNGPNCARGLKKKTEMHYPTYL